MGRAPDHNTAEWGLWTGRPLLGQWVFEVSQVVNLITSAKRKQAAALVREGFSVSLAGDPDEVKAVDNPQPYEHQMQGIGSDRWGTTHM